MKIAIDPGHKCPPDTGAEGFLIEQDLNQDIYNELSWLLIDAGVEVVNCRPTTRVKSVTESLSRRCAIANAAKADYFISIHHNAGGGTGSEIFAISPEGKKLAASVLAPLCALGFRNRGVKERGFLVLRKTNMPAILIEVCFIDNAADCQLWEKLKAKQIASAIFKGLDDCLQITSQS
ncbi:N-acetylmuramoyl-L-alanine amidase [Calothrix sp. PCC 6303]|uniref:N-acetylmuramoyl-L-alanine amidase n=1 Tax=Calothrix sp. PCC 6303 TaxID=1170562 RepID=UPI0002A015F6|nr:N-acetylmuramoyl-L-alanine amidase [Calothrix sp. PCC 6303]AFZ01625.1 cell wall hydrolase/autolysin [Calothrix sp. PCC 6303]